MGTSAFSAVATPTVTAGPRPPGPPPPRAPPPGPPKPALCAPPGTLGLLCVRSHASHPTAATTTIAITPPRTCARRPRVRRGGSAGCPASGSFGSGGDGIMFFLVLAGRFRPTKNDYPESLARCRSFNQRSCLSHRPAAHAHVGPILRSGWNFTDGNRAVDRPV